MLNKHLYRAWNTYEQSWTYAWGSSINQVLVLFRARMLKKIGKCNINQLQRKEDKWKTMELREYTGF